MKALHAIAFILVIIGALNWGLVAFGYNFVNMILGNSSTLESIVYILVALSGIYLVGTHRRDCKMCDSKAPSQSM